MLFGFACPSLMQDLLCYMMFCFACLQSRVISLFSDIINSNKAIFQLI